ncbi:hypothetical protein GCM10010394_43750 [Streptomyces crystallinus]|uniref:Uncharacterized protein n=1 Tax=Streptomyces crystallinus TaxID=68191 RepID=A0ABN1GDC8_9ACTN
MDDEVRVEGAAQVGAVEATEDMAAHPLLAAQGPRPDARLLLPLILIRLPVRLVERGRRALAETVLNRVKRCDDADEGARHGSRA